MRTWQGSDDELDALIDKLNKDSISCEKQFIKIQRDNDDILEVCESTTVAARPQIIRPRNQTGANITPTVYHTIFKTQTELKPAYLDRDCTLPELQQQDSEPAKKVSDSSKVVKPKGKKKRGRKEKAKRVAVLIDSLRLDSPANSSEQENSEDSDNSPSVLGVMDQKTPSTAGASSINVVYVDGRLVYQSLARLTRK